MRCQHCPPRRKGAPGPGALPWPLPPTAGDQEAPLPSGPRELPGALKVDSPPRLASPEGKSPAAKPGSPHPPPQDSTSAGGGPAQHRQGHHLEGTRRAAGPQSCSRGDGRSHSPWRVVPARPPQPAPEAEPELSPQHSSKSPAPPLRPPGGRVPEISFWAPQPPPLQLPSEGPLALGRRRGTAVLLACRAVLPEECAAPHVSGPRWGTVTGNGAKPPVGTGALPPPSSPALGPVGCGWLCGRQGPAPQQSRFPS